MRRLIASIVAAILLVLGGVAIAHAAIPDSTTGVITGCYNNSTGALRVIDAQAGQTCSGGQTQLTWNQQGPPGLADLEDVTVTLPSTYLQPENETEAFAICPSGKAALSGGFDNIGDLTVRAFHRSPAGGSSWHLVVRNDTSAPVQVATRVHALCAVIG